MPVNAIQYIKNVSDDFKQSADSIGAGWDDSVKENFYSAHLENIYKIMDSFYSQTMHEAHELVDKKEKIIHLAESVNNL